MEMVMEPKWCHEICIHFKTLDGKGQRGRAQPRMNGKKITSVGSIVY